MRAQKPELLPLTSRSSHGHQVSAHLLFIQVADTFDNSLRSLTDILPHIFIMGACGHTARHVL